MGMTLEVGPPGRTPQGSMMSCTLLDPLIGRVTLSLVPCPSGTSVRWTTRSWSAMPWALGRISFRVQAPVTMP